MVYVGSAWLSPAGEVIPVAFQQHTETAAEITRFRFPDDASAQAAKLGYADPTRLLCERGWVKVESNGDLCVLWYESAEHLTQAQLDAVWTMLDAALSRQMFNFADGLNRELTRLACSEVA